jgi:hypothetical protein
MCIHVMSCVHHFRHGWHWSGILPIITSGLR